MTDGVIIFFFINIVLTVHDSEVLGQNKRSLDQKSNSEYWLHALFQMYKDILNNDQQNATRRLFKDDKLYMLHVQKLKEVNGLKTHNLKVEEKIPNNETIIYINNPIESSLSHSYLTLNQFKTALWDRVENQKKELENQKKHKLMQKINNQLFKKTKAAAKFKSTTEPTTKYIINDKIDTFIDNFTNEIVDIIDNKLNFIRHKKKNKKRTSKYRPKLFVAKTESTLTSTIETTTVSTEIKMETTTNETNTMEITTTSTEIKMEATTNETSTIEATTTSTEIKMETTTNEPTETTESLADTTESESTTETDSAEIIEETTTELETESTTIASTKPTRRTQPRPFVFMGGS